MAKRDLSYIKPKGNKALFTLSEAAAEIGCDPSWLRKLESQDRIPKALRVKRGAISVRLWTPAQIEEIKGIIASHKVGRPRAT